MEKFLDDGDSFASSADQGLPTSKKREKHPKRIVLGSIAGVVAVGLAIFGLAEHAVKKDNPRSADIATLKANLIGHGWNPIKVSDGKSQFNGIVDLDLKPESGADRDSLSVACLSPPGQSSYTWSVSVLGRTRGGSCDGTPSESVFGVSASLGTNPQQNVHVSVEGTGNFVDTWVLADRDPATNN